MPEYTVYIYLNGQIISSKLIIYGYDKCTTSYSDTINNIIKDSIYDNPFDSIFIKYKKEDILCMLGSNRSIWRCFISHCLKNIVSIPDYITSNPNFYIDYYEPILEYVHLPQFIYERVDNKYLYLTVDKCPFYIIKEFFHKHNITLDLTWDNKYIRNLMYSIYNYTTERKYTFNIVSIIDDSIVYKEVNIISSIDININNISRLTMRDAIQMCIYDNNVSQVIEYLDKDKKKWSDIVDTLFDLYKPSKELLYILHNENLVIDSVDQRGEDCINELRIKFPIRNYTMIFCNKSGNKQAIEYCLYKLLNKCFPNNITYWSRLMLIRIDKTEVMNDTHDYYEPVMRLFDEEHISNNRVITKMILISLILDYSSNLNNMNSLYEYYKSISYITDNDIIVGIASKAEFSYSNMERIINIFR